LRKLFVLAGIGFLTLSVLFFYAERKRQDSERKDSIRAMQEVLKGQNLALAGRIFEGLHRADQDALLSYQRWKKKTKMRSFVSDTTLSEPDAPKWTIVSGRKVRAAGLAEDALLEDALADHLRAPDRLTLYHSGGKYYLFINGKADGQEYASAYAPEAFFSAFRSDDGVRSWFALKDGTIVYHPLSRFVGSNAANIKPVAAGIRELEAGESAPYARSYLGIDGRETLGAWTPLPSYGLLVGSEWPTAPDLTAQSSSYFWLGLATVSLGMLCLGLGSAMGGNSEAKPRLFDEGRLDEDALEYLETARRSAAQAMELVQEKEEEKRQAIQAKQEAERGQGELRWRLALLEDYLGLLSVSGKQVWSDVCSLVTERCPGFSLVYYRYSPTSFSLVPESVHGTGSLASEAIAFLRDTRIFLGGAAYLENLMATEAFQRWDSRRRAQMPLHQTEFRLYPLLQGGSKGAVLALFDGRMNQNGELETTLRLLATLLRATATFCEGQGHLLQSEYAKGSSRALESASDDAGNRPRPS
jgi:hypothetical protein